jgi:hypothetical protein
VEGGEGKEIEKSLALKGDFKVKKKEKSNRKKGVIGRGKVT